MKRVFSFRSTRGAVSAMFSGSAKLALVLLVLAVVAIGCAQPASDESSPPAELLPVAWPDFDRLDPKVAADLSQQRQMLVSLRQRFAGPEGQGNAPVQGAELGQAYGDTGRLFHAYELYSAAEDCYRNARLLQPKVPEWRYYLGRLLASQGRPADAIVELEGFLDSRPDDRPAQVALAQALATTGDTAGARALFEQQLEQEASALVHFELGQLTAEAGEIATAADHFEHALALQPSASRIHLPLARAYRQLGRDEDAERHLALRGEGPLQTQDPLLEQLGRLATSFRSFLDQGVNAFRQRDYAGAARAFEQAVEIEPDNANARQNLASALLLSGQADLAEAQYRRAIELEPDLAQAHFNLGTLLGGQGEHDGAIEQLQRAIAIDPNYRDAHFNLAKQLLDSRRWAEALASFERVLELDPGNAGAYLGAGRSLAGAGRWSAALARLEAGRKALPNDSGLVISQVRILAAAPAEAVRDGNQALLLAEELLSRQHSAPHLEVQAMALAELGRYPEAIAHQRAAIELAGQATEHLTDTLERYLAGTPCREPWPGIG